MEHLPKTARLRIMSRISNKEVAKLEIYNSVGVLDDEFIAAS